MHPEVLVSNLSKWLDGTCGQMNDMRLVVQIDYLNIFSEERLLATSPSPLLPSAKDEHAG